MYCKPRLHYLITVSQAAHARHDAENVVVHGIDADLGARRGADRVVGERNEERGIVNAGKVARARRLVLLWAESKAVAVDTRRRRAAVVLVGLHTVEVGALTLSETVLAVEL